MKKDKKWFIDKWTKERDKTDVHDPMYHFINEFITDVRLLDEPEVSAEDSIDKNKEDSDVHYKGYCAPIGRVHDPTLPTEEEPLYCALIKGHEVITNNDTFKYWNFDTFNNGIFLSNRDYGHERYLTEMSKEDWEKLGINETNANFVKMV